MGVAEASISRAERTPRKCDCYMGWRRSTQPLMTRIWCRGPARRCGVNAQVKVSCLVAGMVAGAGSIDDLDVLRHGALPALFGGVRAPSTLGSFRRSFTWGNVLQLGKVNRLLLAGLARRAPLLPGGGVLAFVDLGSTQKRVYGQDRFAHGVAHFR